MIPVFVQIQLSLIIPVSLFLAIYMQKSFATVKKRLINHPMKHCVIQWPQDDSDIHSITFYLRLPKNRSLISYIQIFSVVVLGKAAVEKKQWKIGAYATNHILHFISCSYFLSCNHIHFTKITSFSGKINEWYALCIYHTCSFSCYDALQAEEFLGRCTVFIEKTQFCLWSYLQTHIELTE